VPEVKVARLKSKIEKLKEEIVRLNAINAEMMRSEDKQISLNDPDARATSGKADNQNANHRRCGPRPRRKRPCRVCADRQGSRPRRDCQRHAQLGTQILALIIRLSAKPASDLPPLGSASPRNQGD